MTTSTNEHGIYIACYACDSFDNLAGRLLVWLVFGSSLQGKVFRS